MDSSLLIAPKPTPPKEDSPNVPTLSTINIANLVKPYTKKDLKMGRILIDYFSRKMTQLQPIRKIINLVRFFLNYLLITNTNNKALSISARRDEALPLKEEASPEFPTLSTVNVRDLLKGYDLTRVSGKEN